MATAADWICPICREASSEIAYVGDCLHQFCHSCIVRWARKNPSCPLCRRTVYSIICPAAPNPDFAEMPQRPEPQRPEPQRPEPQRAGPRDEPRAAAARVAGFSAETWALCFRTYADILRPVELWLDQVLCGACWWDVAFAQGRIVASLCRYGLQEEALMRELHPFLGEQTLSFVRRLFEVAADQCSELARRRVRTACQQALPDPAALPGPSRPQQQRRELSEPAGASGAGQSARSGAETASQSRRRRVGGCRDGAAPYKRHWRRQN